MRHCALLLCGSLGCPAAPQPLPCRAPTAASPRLRCRSLEPAGRLAAELLPFARVLASRGGYPALARLQPARWSRYWSGQLYEQQGWAQAGGGGGGWQEEAEEEQAAAAAAAGEQAPDGDAIEESEDEDDW